MVYGWIRPGSPFFVPFKNGFNTITWCCLHIPSKRSKMLPTKNSDVDGTCKQAFTQPQHYYYHPPITLREGNVFTRLCLSVHGGGGGVAPCAHHCRPVQTCSLQDSYPHWHWHLVTDIEAVVRYATCWNAFLLSRFDNSCSFKWRNVFQIEFDYSLVHILFDNIKIFPYS